MAVVSSVASIYDPRNIFLPSYNKMGRSHYNKKKKNILAPSLNVFVFSCGLLPVASGVTGNVILNFSCIFMVFCDCSSKSQLSCGKSFVICFSSGSFLSIVSMYVEIKTLISPVMKKICLGCFLTAVMDFH